MYLQHHDSNELIRDDAWICAIGIATLLPILCTEALERNRRPLTRTAPLSASKASSTTCTSGARAAFGDGVPDCRLQCRSARLIKPCHGIAHACRVL